MKRFLFVLIVLFIFHQAWSQASIGPVAGMNFSTITGGEGSTKFKMGFHAGAYMKFRITDQIFFQPEMLYSKIGYKQELSYGKSGMSTDTTLSHSLSYINFPFLVGITVAGNGFIHIGPQIGYIANAKAKGTVLTTINGSSLPQNIDTSDVYGFSTTEYAIVVGGGYKFPYGLNASLHVTYGLTKLYTSGTEHNLVIGISVGYKLGRGGDDGRGAERVYKRL